MLGQSFSSQIGSNLSRLFLSYQVVLQPTQSFLPFPYKLFRTLLFLCIFQLCTNKLILLLFPPTFPSQWALEKCVLGLAIRRLRLSTPGKISFLSLHNSRAARFAVLYPLKRFTFFFLLYHVFVLRVFLSTTFLFLCYFVPGKQTRSQPSLSVNPREKEGTCFDTFAIFVISNRNDGLEKWLHFEL